MKASENIRNFYKTGGANCKKIVGVTTLFTVLFGILMISIAPMAYAYIVCSSCGSGGERV